MHFGQMIFKRASYESLLNYSQETAAARLIAGAGKELALCTIGATTITGDVDNCLRWVFDLGCSFSNFTVV